MKHQGRFLAHLSVLVPLALFLLPVKTAAQANSTRNAALINGLWFTGKTFEARVWYSVNGQFTARKPARIDTTLDLGGLYIVPPFAEAHNHNLNGGNPLNPKAVAKYLADGVFYVKEPGNFYLSDEEKKQLNLNQPTGIDVSLAQGASLTATWGHPYQLAEQVWFKFGYAKGPIDSLNGRRFFTIDSEQDLEKKWPEILKQHPDFIKTILWSSDEYQQRKQNKAFYGQAGLKPEFLEMIVKKAHAANLRVSTHIINAHDFHVAVTAGVDEIAHLPITGLTPIAADDAKLAARRGVVVVTTCSVPVSLPPPILPRSLLPQVLQVQKDNLKLLHKHGVTLAIGSDIPTDSSVEEFETIRKTGVFDNLTLLKMWTENTPGTIFPTRKIGMLKEGYQASFLALEGNPLDNLDHVRKIRYRFKQGRLLRP